MAEPGTVAPAAETSQTTSQTTSSPSPPIATSSSTGQQPPKLTSKLIQDPAAFLAARREAAGLKPRQPAAAKPAAEQGTAPAAPSTDAAPAEPAKPAESADDMAARLAKFSREEREFARRQREFEESQRRAKVEREAAEKEHAERLARAAIVDKANEAIKSGDMISAIKLMSNDLDPNAVALQLLEQLNKEDERTMSPAEVERMVADKLKAAEEAKAKAAEEQRKAEQEKEKAAIVGKLEEAREQYMVGCAEVFAQKAAEFPWIKARGLDRGTILSFVESRRDESGRMIATDAEDVFKHFEAKYKAEAEAAGYTLKQAVQTIPAPAPSLSPSSLTSDSGGRVRLDPATKPSERLARAREKIKNDLRLLQQRT